VHALEEALRINPTQPELLKVKEELAARKG
jgi:hypothetical protein